MKFLKEFGIWIFASAPMTILISIAGIESGHWWLCGVFPLLSLLAALAITGKHPWARRELLGRRD